jgi:hypothetical protein
MNAEYQEFISDKVAISRQTGLDIQDQDIHPILKPHQRDCVKYAVTGGRRAIFAAFGLGKSIMQLESLRIIKAKTGCEALIVCPLGVRNEFKRDAGLIDVDACFVRTTEEMEVQQRQMLLLTERQRPVIWVTNYESIREGKLDVTRFGAVSLDEAAILRGFGGTKTFRELMGYFEGSSTYRFVATATPSPNEFIELLSYAAYLGIMQVGEAKTRFFKRDSTNADNLKLHPHKVKEFWMWCSSWAIFLQRPSDLGYSDEGYALPELDVRWHEVPSNHSVAKPDRNGQGRLLNDVTLSVSNAAAEKKSSLSARIEKLLELREEDPLAHRVIWHDLETEREAIEQAIPGIASIYGRRPLEEREMDVARFANGEIPELATKPSLTGAGCNLQRHCHWAIFFGIDFKFHAFIQACHRLHRFLQTKTVRIDLIYTEAEREVRRTLERKWAQHKVLVEEMSKIIREFGLAHESIKAGLKQTVWNPEDRREKRGENWRMVNNDTILELNRTEDWPDNSVGLILTSIPFSNQYQYSPIYNDLGANEDNAKFWKQMDFLTPQLMRVLKPGRICAIHVKDRITPSGLTGLGFQTAAPLHAEAIFHYIKHGFGYLGMKTIVTDVVRENNQTYRLGWTEQCKDGTKMGCGMPEYLLIFRKPATDRSNGYADEPVVKEKPLCDDNGIPAPFDTKTNWRKPIPGTGYSRSRWQLDAHGFARSSGNRLLSSEELRQLNHQQLYRRWKERSESGPYSFAEHLAMCEELDRMERLPATFMLFPPHSTHPDVWSDVARMQTLNNAQSAEGRQMHLCPVQFDICERAILQWTMKGEIVFDPFGGIGTVPMMAVKLGRKGYGVELNTAYWLDGCHYCERAELKQDTLGLLELMELGDLDASPEAA